MSQDPNILCAVCDYPASEPFHDPKYGSHLFQASVTKEVIEAFETLREATMNVAEISPVSGELYAFTKPEPLYYVVYWSRGSMRYYLYRGSIETAGDLERLIQSIAEDHKRAAVLVNWKRIS